MSGVQVDTSDLQHLVAELGQAQARLLPEGRKVVAKGCLNIKTDWRKAWSGLAHAPALPAAITYDTTMTATSVRGEVGPDKSRPQGALGNLLEYGSLKNAPRPGGAPALAAEAPRFERALADLGVQLLPGGRP